MWVEAGGAAERAGLEAGDILVGIGDTAVADHEKLVNILSEHGAGTKVDVQVLRGGALRSVALTIGSV